VNDELLALVGAWIAADPDENDRATVEQLLNCG
jgi:hypothetical protein